MKKRQSMQPRQFRIGELANSLNVKKYVVRFWEKEFGLSSDRSHGGQRFYTEADRQLFIKIKHLLYTEGFTIAGARQQLKNKNKHVLTSVQPARIEHRKETISQKLGALKAKLIKLRASL